MKKLVLAIALLATSTVALADRDDRGRGYGYRGGYERHEYHHHNDWIGPMVGGAVIGAVIYDIYNRPRVVQQPPVVVYQQPQVIYTQPTYHHESIYNSSCGCYQDVLVRD
jgi:hypothetical protein